ncbi:MAG: GtrA family protein [Rhodobacteraceae bacterium]|nr:GtrA family protein [Paracoccaceae bacterium]
MISALRDRPDLWRFVKFLFVGVVNTGFGFAAYAFFLRVVGFDPHLALACSYVIGVLWNFMTHSKVVFHSGSVWRLPLYVINYVVIYYINLFLLEHLIAYFEGAGLWARTDLAQRAGIAEHADLWAQAILVFPMAMLTFIGVSIVLTGRIPFLSKLFGRKG